ncbi:50S ribosomal protein L25 [Chloroflexota bacterium]
MDKVELLANSREILGKKVRFLRRQGITPVNIYGHNIKSVALQCTTAQLQRALAQAGKTRLISLKVDETTAPRNVMVREVQKESRTGALIHVDLYQVSMVEKIRVEVPIIPVGEAPALRLKENSLTHELNSLTIECLPDEFPNVVELDVSSLTETDQAIHVKDIILPEGITVLNDSEQLVVKIIGRPTDKEEGEAPSAAPPPE